MNENRNFNEDFEIEQAGPEDVGCDLFETPKKKSFSKSLSADGDVHG